MAHLLKKAKVLGLCGLFDGGAKVATLAMDHGISTDTTRWAHQKMVGKMRINGGYTAKIYSLGGWFLGYSCSSFHLWAMLVHVSSQECNMLIDFVCVCVCLSVCVYV